MLLSICNLFFAPVATVTGRICLNKNASETRSRRLCVEALVIQNVACKGLISVPYAIN